MVSIQIDTSGRIYYASRLNYYTVEKVGNEELYVDYDMVSVRYKLDKYDRIVYTESRYLPYHQHGEVQVYTGANAAGAITVMSGSLLNNFVADLVDLYKFIYQSPKSIESKEKVTPSQTGNWHVKCQKCQRELPQIYVDAQSIYCVYCGSKNIKRY